MAVAGELMLDAVLAGLPALALSLQIYKSQILLAGNRRLPWLIAPPAPAGVVMALLVSDDCRLGQAASELSRQHNCWHVLACGG